MKPLQHKKHTLAKRGLSLLCILALCLSLLPVTALAVEGAPNSLYVGDQQVINGNNTTFWTTDKSTGGLTKYEGNDDSWNVKYDPSTATLTLNGATINGAHATTSPPYGAGIYAPCSSNQSVALTIELIGTNTITGYYGIYVNANQGTPSGADASLVIKNGGDNDSLTVTGTGNSGLFIASGTGNASLTIENASVDAKTTQTYSGYAGVFVQSGSTATNSPNISLSVDGGSLTASGTESSDGILFYVGSSQATGATTSLTVSENAIVDARNGGISASRILVTLPTPTPTGDNRSGIVFDGSTGTVYGDVTLDESLTINQGETLTVPSGAELNCNGKLTNNGTILASGGTLSGGTTLTTPNITEQPTGQTVEEGETATFTVEASDAQTYQWQVSTDNGQNWADISGANDDSYTTVATTTDMSGYQYRCMVKSASGVGVISQAATLTVQAKPASVPVTDVSLDKDTLSLYTGDTASLTATVEPDNATNQNVTWSSDNADVATVDNGTVTAVGAGKTTISVTTEDGGKTATCTVTVTDKTYAISADATALNFGSAYTGYAQPAAKTVTMKNTGNQPVTLNQPSSTDNFVVGNLTDTELVAGETATFKVQPKAGLAAGTYSDTITVSDTNNNVTSSITASFTVKSRPSYNPPTVSEETTDAIADAQPGDTVTVDLSRGSTKLDKEVFEELSGRDVTLVIELGDGLSWTVNGTDVPEDASLTDIDLGVTMNSDGIPVEVVNAITGERDSVQLTLAHDGAFGFTMTLAAPLGEENAGYWANLYHFDEEAGEMTFETAAQIGDDGNVSLPLSHASQYAIVIDDHNHGVVTLPFTDVREGDWFYDPVCYVYSQGLMTGTSATTFEPNTSLSRAMLVAVLHRLEGSPQASAGDFIDVADGDWYAQAVNWAASVGVVNGFDDGTFQPNAAITREQMAAILRNYAAYKGMNVTAIGDLSTYTDAASVSDWAQESVEWMVGSGLLGGYDDNTLRPQGTTTRAEVASVLQRALGNVAENQ